ncbi:MAG: NAD(P)-dependent oxidoreductase [Solirubrobacteraceae bacterium]
MSGTRQVVLVDPLATLEPVAAALARLPRLDLVHARHLPRGGGIVAVLVPPEVPVGADQLAGLPDLQIVAATSAGFDHLDLEAIAGAGAWATHCPGYCDQEVAEHAIAFVLDLLRGVTFLDRSVHDGEWDYARAAPRRVAGAVLGVVGLGRIGREVARRALALEMSVLAADPAVQTSDLPGLQLTSLAELLDVADVVTLHAPLTARTRGMIGAKQLAAMGPGGYLVNCARAELVDHDALGEALRRGRLAGCAIDVLPREPPAPDQPELSWPRTLINPHAAWFSPQSATAPYRRAGEAVAAVLAGREPADAIVRPYRVGRSC